MLISKQIENVLDEISIILMSLERGKVSALNESLLSDAAKRCDVIRSISLKDSSHRRLVTACEYVLGKKAELKAEEFVQLLQDFITGVQAYLCNSSLAVFPHEKPSFSVNPEFGDCFDEEFLPEFISKHNLLLEEFEAAVLDFKFKTKHDKKNSVETFGNYVKSYLHGIKGEAGVVGLSGIEKVTHTLEDMLSSQVIDGLLDELVNYKEWLWQCLAAFSKNVIPNVTSEQFLELLLINTGAVKEDVKAVVAHSAPINHNDATGESYVIQATQEVLAEFIAEATEYLNTIESVLFESPKKISVEQFDTLYRVVHSLKGTSSFFNLREMQMTSHQLEEVFGANSDRVAQLGGGFTALVFAYCDLQRQLCNSAQEAVCGDGIVHPCPATPEFLRCIQLYRSKGEANEDVPDIEERENLKIPEVVEDITQKETVRERSGEGLELKTFVKVDTKRLDRLVDAIGELEIYTSILIRDCKELFGANERVQSTCEQVEKFSRELQDIGMSMRLDPIKSLFHKMARLVWDGSKKLGKQIQFTMKGEDTELDRNVIEKLADPLMHMVRNAVDHGVDTPEERSVLGKPIPATVELSAAHEGGCVVVRVRDDGRGIDPNKLIQKAIEKGIIDASHALSEKEALNLIFVPGFSTAKVVTDISGRGVGMDVVRNNIESMRGRIQIESEIGKGTTFIIELPLTLAIVHGIEIVVGEEQYVIPTLSVVESLRPTRDMISKTLNRDEMLEFRGNFLPIIRLSRLYDIQGARNDPTEALLIVVESGRERVALMVDEIVGYCQTVIKTLGVVFGDNKGLAGCAIMANGNISLILDVHTLIELAKSTYYNSSHVNNTCHDDAYHIQIPSTVEQDIGVNLLS